MSTYKVGDELAFHCGSTSRYWEIAEIEKITPSGRMKCGRWEVNPDLTIRGKQDGWHGPWRAQAVTDEIRKDIRNASNLRFVQGVKWREVPRDVLAKLVRIIKEHGAQ